MTRLALVPELEQELDRLYATPLEEFTAARNELATRMKQAGQNAIATRIRELRKPSVAVWTVNQLARRHPDEVRALVEAGKRLRSAQEQALKGRGADAVRAAQREEREASRTLTRRAEKLLTDEGRTASQQTLERVNATLRAAAVDPQAAELLAAGRLAEEVESPGFAAVASIAPAGARAPKQRRAADDRAAKREYEQRLRQLRREAESAERRAAAAEAEAERLAGETAEARERAKAARREAREAAKALAAAERR